MPSFLFSHRTCSLHITMDWSHLYAILKSRKIIFFSQPKKLSIYSVLKTHPLDNTVAKIVQNREIWQKTSTHTKVSKCKADEGDRDPNGQNDNVLRVHFGSRLQNEKYHCHLEPQTKSMYILILFMANNLKIGGIKNIKIAWVNLVIILHLIVDQTSVNPEKGTGFYRILAS